MFKVVGKQYRLIIWHPPYVDAEDLKNSPAEFFIMTELALTSGEDGLFHRNFFLAQVGHICTMTVY